jgi:hypothetical protein
VASGRFGSAPTMLANDPLVPFATQEWFSTVTPSSNPPVAEGCSILVATVIGSVVSPTLIANAVHLPRHLIPKAIMEGVATSEPVIAKGAAAEAV